MGEDENNKKIDTDEILKETANTVNEVKDQVKKSFKKEELKNSAEQTKNFIIGMFKDPIGELKIIANDSSNNAFKYAVILTIVWILAVVISLIASYISLSINVFKRILPIIKVAVSPILTISVLSLIIFVMNKKRDKGLMTIMSVVTATKLPVVIARVVSLLKIFSVKASTITSPFTSLCAVISSVLLFFGIKFITGEEEDKENIKKFVIIEGIYYISAIIISFLDISI